MKIIIEITPFDHNPNISDLLIEISEMLRYDKNEFDSLLYQNGKAESDNAEYKLIINE